MQHHYSPSVQTVDFGHHSIPDNPVTISIYCEINTIVRTSHNAMTHKLLLQSPDCLPHLKFMTIGTDKR